LTGTFEEYFGQLHYWEGYPYAATYDKGPNPIWRQLGERITREISQSVVSIASFKGDVYSCILITLQDSIFILTNRSSDVQRTRGVLLAQACL
jgi:hypothetical protein